MTRVRITDKGVDLIYQELSFVTKKIKSIKSNIKVFTHSLQLLTNLKRIVVYKG